MELEEQIRNLSARGEHRTAAEVAIRALTPTVLRLLRSILRDDDDAADALSLFAENIWRGLPAFRGDASLRTWSLRLAVHSAARVRRQAWRLRVRRFHTGEASRIAEEFRTASAIRRERHDDSLAALRKSLRPTDSALLALRVDQKLPWSEIAAILSRGGKPVGVPALCKRFERLKERLKGLAEQEGLLQ